MRDFVFPPLILPIFLLLVVLPFFTVFFVFTSSRIFQILFGLSYSEALWIFLMIILGSFVNIPIYEKEGREIVMKYYVFGFMYTVRKREKITIAVNLGGCVFPVILALRLLSELPISCFLLAFTISTAVIYYYAKPIPGVGIAVPVFIPPVIASLSSLISLVLLGYPILLLPKLSFTSGVLAALFGADILHLKDVEQIGSGVVSIGGAGTFDGIFLTGIFAVIFSFFLI